MLDEQSDRRRAGLDRLLEPVDPLVGDAEVDELGCSGPGSGSHREPGDPPHGPAEDEAEQPGPQRPRQRRPTGLRIDGLPHVRRAVLVLDHGHGVLQRQLAVGGKTRGCGQELLGTEDVHEGDPHEDLRHGRFVTMFAHASSVTRAWS